MKTVPLSSQCVPSQMQGLVAKPSRCNPIRSVSQSMSHRIELLRKENEMLKRSLDGVQRSLDGDNPSPQGSPPQQPAIASPPRELKSSSGLSIVFASAEVAPWRFVCCHSCPVLSHACSCNHAYPPLRQGATWRYGHQPHGLCPGHLFKIGHFPLSGC